MFKKILINLPIVLIFSIYASNIEAKINIFPLEKEVYQGEQINIKMIISEIEPKKVDLFFRVKGSRDYQRLTYNNVQEANDYIIIQIPETVVISPGLEYYVEVVDTSGNKFTSPQHYPKYNPYSIKIVKNKPLPEIYLISPKDQMTITDQTNELIFETKEKIEDYTVLVVINNTDVTDATTFSDKKIILPTNVLPEEDTIEIEIAIKDKYMNERKNSWKLKRDDSGKGKNVEIHATGGISINYGKQLKSPSGNKKDTLSGNLSMSMKVKGKNWQFNWSGVNLQYVKDSPTKEFTISSGFHFVYEKNEQMFEFGDISVKETKLTAPSFARRGVQVKLKGYNTELHVFNVSADTVSGWSAGIGGTDRQIYGVSIKRAMLPEDKLPLTLVFITGKNQVANGYNAAGTQAGSEGDIVGIAANHEIWGVSFQSELALSRYNDNISDNIGKKKDIACTVDISTQIQKTTIGGSYFYYGPDFASIANPNFTKDRTGISARASKSIGGANVSLNLSRQRDNVEGDPNRPVVYSTTGAISLGLSLSPWPNINVSYTRSMQNSEKEPQGTNKVDNVNDTISLGLSKSSKNWSASVNGNYGKLKDKAGNLDGETRGVNISGSYTPFKGFSLSPSASYTESKSSGITKRTRLITLTAGIPMFSSYVNTSFQVSYSLNDASDGSQDSSTLNGSWRLSLNIHEFVKKWIDYGSETLALSANYSKVDDNVNPSNSGEDFSIFLTINFHAPLNFNFGF